MGLHRDQRSLFQRRVAVKEDSCVPSRRHERSRHCLCIPEDRDIQHRVTHVAIMLPVEGDHFAPGAAFCCFGRVSVQLLKQLCLSVQQLINGSQEAVVCVPYASVSVGLCVDFG